MASFTWRQGPVRRTLCPDIISLTYSPRTIEIITRLTYIKEPQSRETERTTRNRNNLLDLLNNGKPPELEDYPGKLSINVDKANDTLVRIKREEIDWAEDAGLGERDDEIEENIQCKTNKLIREEWNSGD